MLAAMAGSKLPPPTVAGEEAAKSGASQNAFRKRRRRRETTQAAAAAAVMTMTKGTTATGNRVSGGGWGLGEFGVLVARRRAIWVVFYPLHALQEWYLARVVFFSWSWTFRVVWFHSLLWLSGH